MQLNRALLSNKKILMTGLGGRGKTFGAHEISKLFKCMIYTQHKDDIQKYWGKDKVLLAIAKDYVKEFPFWCLIARMCAENKKINCFIVDDSDAIFKNHFDTCPQLADLVVNNWHYGLTIIFIARRPQDIPTKVYNAFEILMLWPIEAPQAIQLLNKYSEGLGDQVKELPYESHEFIFKHVGQPPVRMMF